MPAPAPHETAPSPRPRVVLIGMGPFDFEAGASRAAPGLANRLWHFASQALAAGLDCILLEIVAQAPDFRLERRTRGALAWRQAAVSVAACKAPPGYPAGLQALLAEALAGEAGPCIYVGAGTLLAGAAACCAAGDAPVWADLFGDPLAEIAAKAEVAGERFSADEYLDVWRLMQTVLARADAYSTVTRRQAEGLVAQLLLAGREETLGDPRLAERIHAMPCAVEMLELFPPLDAAGREALRADVRRRHGLSAEARVALWSGGFNAWSDPETLVHGAERALARDPRLHLVATGAELPGYLADVYHRFTALATASPHATRIHALGWLERAQADAWLCAADAALMVDRPCTETQFGARNRLLYHAAAGTPIVASRGTEVVLDMEHAGALLAFEPGDAAGLADALHTALAGGPRAERLAETALAWCDRNYRFDTTSHGFLRFLANPPRPMQPRQGAAIVQHLMDYDARAADLQELHARRSEGLRGALGRWRQGRK